MADIPGSHSPDTLQGAPDADSITGLPGNDFLAGFGGVDTLDGGEGQDSLDGGAQDDTRHGLMGDDDLAGGNGADVVHAGAGADRLQFNTELLSLGLPTGPLDPARLNSGSAVGPDAQFVLTYDDVTDLRFDPNGDQPSGGAYAFAILDGNVTVLGADILIF